MPFAPHMRLTVSGTLGGTMPTGAGAPEQFSYGLSIAALANATFSPNSANGQPYSQDMVDDVLRFHARPATKIHGNAVAKTVKVAQIGADGKYASDPFIAEVNVQGGLNFNSQVPQMSLAVSLNTDRRGASGRGRFFLPMPGIIASAETFLTDLPATVGIRDSVKLLIDDLNNMPGLDFGDLKVVVASTKGFNSRVTSVRVGRVQDTIRSRRRSIGENYTADALIA